MNPTDIFKGPIPGQSLTRDPDSKGPWELPPKFETVPQSLDHLFKVVTSKKFTKNLNHLLSEDKKFFIDEIAASMLTEGFINGLWTVDCMLLLAEPLMILLIWACAQLDKSPSFSSDTGYEDRTGFEELVESFEVEMENLNTPEASVEGPQEIPEASQQSPLTSNIPQSPLTGGL